MKQIYCDMDGVLVNFADPALSRINAAINGTHIPKVDGTEKLITEIQKKIGTREVIIDDIMIRSPTQVPEALDLMFLLIKGDSGFWATLPWATGGRALWAAISPLNPIILSSPYDEASKIGKYEWIYKNLRCEHLPPPQVILDSKKEMYASPESALIDDMRFNCESWEAAGGIAIQHSSKNVSPTFLSLLKLFS